MADFNSKYTGEQVEEFLDQIANGEIGGGGGEGEVQKTTEAEITAMGFTKNLGTITEVKMNGASKGTSGVVDLGTVITEHQDISGKQDKITDLEAIRSGAGKGATALQSVPSEYVTETQLNDKGYLTSVPAEYVTETELTNKGYATTSDLDKKVDKISGKQLSTEDFTSALKSKLEGLSNYDDTTISNAVSSLQTQINTLVSGNANDAINSFNEIIAFLDGIKDTQDLASIIAAIEQQIAGKYTKPLTGIPESDLAVDVQTSLSKANTALQSYTEQYKGTVSTVDTSDIVDEPDVPQVQNAVSTNRIIACVARFDGTQWNLINDEGHVPLNVTGISGTSTDEFTITFPAYSKVNSLVATPDETLAAGGIKCGASVGLDYATIRLRQDRMVRLFVTINANGNGGTVTRQEWDTRTDVSGFTVSIVQNTSLGAYVRLDDTKGNIDGTALPTIGGSFNTFLFGTKPGYINVQLRTADGSVSDYKNAQFQIGWPMLNVKPIFTSQELSKGNVWIYGIMEE